MSPIIDVFTAAETLRAAYLAAEIRRLRADNRRLRDTVAAQDARLDLLQRANERHESARFQVRDGVHA